MEFWDIIQLHMDEYGVSEAMIARKAGMHPGTLNSWRKRGVPKIPERADIAGLAAVTRRPYVDLLDAVLHETGYLDSHQLVVDVPSGGAGREHRPAV